MQLHNLSGKEITERDILLQYLPDEETQAVRDLIKEIAKPDADIEELALEIADELMDMDYVQCGNVAINPDNGDEITDALVDALTMNGFTVYAVDENGRLEELG